MKYTINDLNKEFPTEESCLRFLFNSRFSFNKCPKCGKPTKFHLIKNRKRFDCQWCGHGIYPLSGTIFHKSRTSLRDWFYVMFKFANSRNGVAALEIQRDLGVTYKCAWRMAHQVRLLFAQNHEKLSGVIECDETFLGGRRKQSERLENKTAIMGMAERKGRLIAKKIPNRETHIILGNISQHITVGSHLMTDEFRTYRKANKMGYIQKDVQHRKGQYVCGTVSTNLIEGFWSQLKRSIDGTYHAISPKYVQNYVDEFVWRYNVRLVPDKSVFRLILQEVVRKA